MRRKFWDTASREKKIEMMRHAAEARLTTRETAILLEAPSKHAIKSLADRFGVSFENADQIAANRIRGRKYSDEFSLSFRQHKSYAPPPVDEYLRKNS